MAKCDQQHIPDKKLLASLGVCIRDIRRKKNLTIEQLSARANINFKYLQRCETGKCNPSVSILVSIAKGLDIKPENLLKKI